MTVPEIKNFIGRTVAVNYHDRLGNPCEATGLLLEVAYIPMYGSNLVFDFGEVALDRVVELCDLSAEAAA